MSMAYVTLDDEYRRVYADEIATVGLICAFCGKKLKNGSFVDGQYPWNTQNNCHKSCKKRKDEPTQ